MFFKEWVVLLVDDEPDVLSMTKMAIKKFNVYGLPLKIYTAESKKEAIALINNNPDLESSLAVAFIDVVMETDSAGLELVEYIRDEMENRQSQLFIRTGQPGLSTEMDVIDKYDINGYFTKIEVTRTKLYSLIKSSVRQYLSYSMALSTAEILKNLISASLEVTKYYPELSLYSLTRSRRAILDVVRPLGGYSSELEDISRWLFVDRFVLFGEEIDSSMGIEIRDKMLSLKGIVLDPDGDQYIKGEEGFHLIQVTEKPTQSEIIYLFQTRFEPPEHVIKLMYSVFIGLSTAWRQAC